VQEKVNLFEANDEKKPEEEKKFSLFVQDQ
jgi:hypothetical protein